MKHRTIIGSYSPILMLDISDTHTHNTPFIYAVERLYVN